MSAVEKEQPEAANTRFAKDQLKAFVERIERLEEEKKTISDDIRDRPINELMASVAEFAGQKPMAFFGCGILAGLVVSRLLSSSNR